jgi:hypothetical protein
LTNDIPRCHRELNSIVDTGIQWSIEVVFPSLFSHRSQKVEVLEGKAENEKSCEERLLVAGEARTELTPSEPGAESEVAEGAAASEGFCRLRSVRKNGSC